MKGSVLPETAVTSPWPDGGYSASGGLDEGGTGRVVTIQMRIGHCQSSWSVPAFPYPTYLGSGH